MSLYTALKKVSLLKNNLVQNIDYKYPINFTFVFVLNFVFILFYFLFNFFADVIHQTGVLSNINNINPWISSWMDQNDGIELYVMTLFMPIYLGIGYLITKSISANYLSNKYLLIPYAIGIFIVFALRFWVTSRPNNFDNSIVIFFVLLSLSFLAIQLAKVKYNLRSKIIISLLGLSLLVVFGLLINTPASIFDFSYYIGPANKILAGEKLGSFYIQYNLIGTYLFALMQSFGIEIHQMFFILIFVFSLWILLYVKAAKMLFKNNSYVLLFLLTLIVVRCLAISDGPVNIPQVSAIRMDLWVPLVIILLRFGFSSLITASAFSMCYISDDVFGFMYLALYIFSLVCIGIHEYTQTRLVQFSIKSLIILLPITIVILIHLMLFKSISSPSSKIYSNLHIGFLPISSSSSFWFIAWLLPLCVYILTQSKVNQAIYLFIAGIACIQLTYFFGRSHDHNLLNISGIFIFILFLTVDSLYSNIYKNRKILYGTVIMIACIGVNYEASIKDKLNLALRKIRTHTITEPYAIEKQLDIHKHYLKTLNTDKILIISDIDCYVNYRLGYRQIGYFSPFLANVFIDQTSSFLKSQLNNGYRLIIYPSIYSDLEKGIISLNSNTDKDHFKVTPLELGLMEITLVPNN